MRKNAHYQPGEIVAVGVDLRRRVELGFAHGMCECRGNAQDTHFQVSRMCRIHYKDFYAAYNDFPVAKTVMK